MDGREIRRRSASTNWVIAAFSMAGTGLNRWYAAACLRKFVRRVDIPQTVLASHAGGNFPTPETRESSRGFGHVGGSDWSDRSGHPS